MHWYSKQRQAHRQLHVHDLEGMDGGDRERSRLLVLVVQLVEVLVQETSVVQAMEDVGGVVLEINSYLWD